MGFRGRDNIAEQHPDHKCEKSDKYLVILFIVGQDGKLRRAKAWDVALK